MKMCFFSAGGSIIFSLLLAVFDRMKHTMDKLKAKKKTEGEELQELAKQEVEDLTQEELLKEVLLELREARKKVGGEFARMSELATETKELVMAEQAESAKHGSEAHAQDSGVVLPTGDTFHNTATARAGLKLGDKVKLKVRHCCRLLVVAVLSLQPCPIRLALLQTCMTVESMVVS